MLFKTVKLLRWVPAFARRASVFAALALGALPPVHAAAAPPGTTINNQATLAYTVSGSSQPSANSSNVVAIQVPAELDRIGIAKAASVPLMNTSTNGASDGTATVRFSLRVRNYSSVPVYRLSVTDLMEGSGSTQFGTYTAAAAPGTGQYTVVAGSVALSQVQGSGTSVSLNPSFTGQANTAELLQSGGVLAVNGEFTVQFDVRYSVTGRTGQLLNSAQARAALSPNADLTVSDQSTDGSNPDANGDGDPTNDTAATPVPTQLPALAVNKSVTASRTTSTAGVYEIDYAISVSNVGNASAPNVHVMDSLDCAYGVGRSDSSVASWQLLKPPVSQSGVLSPVSSFTGQGPANCPDSNANPQTYPAGSSVNLVDGSRSLAPGQSETLSFTVKVTLKPDAISGGALLSNQAWAVGTPSAALDPTGSTPLTVAFGSTDVILQVTQPQLTSLTLEKTGSTKQAEMGDFIDFMLNLANNGATTLTDIRLQDQLPRGFSYVPGTARGGFIAAGAAGSTASLKALPDPQGGRGPLLNFVAPASAQLVPKGQWVVRYRVRVVPGVPSNGEAINQAQGFASTDSTVVLASNRNRQVSSTRVQGASNVASWRVKVAGGVMGDAAFAFGKVFLDCNRDGVQSDSELGIPGVRLMLEDGTSVVTDAEGKWSLYGLRPVTHALKVDLTTLPEGAHLAAFSNRHAGAGDSQFLDLKNGEWHKANFAVDNCSNQAMVDEVKARRKAIAAQPAMDGQLSNPRGRFDPKGQATLQTDPRAMPASGDIGSDGSVRGNIAVARPLIDLPNGGPGQSATALATTQSQAFSPVFKPLQPSLPSNPLPGADDPEAVDALSAPAAPPLEDALSGLDNSLGFVGLQPGQTLTTAMINIRLKGPLPGQIKLKVNGEPVDDKRIGKRVTLAARDLRALEYIGIPLRGGENGLEAEASDDFGNVRERVRIQLVAPGEPTQIELTLPQTAPADGKTPIKVKVRITDSAGLPIHTRLPITLDSNSGRWNMPDLSPSEPGWQAFVQGDGTEFELIPPAAPGDGRVRVFHNKLVREARIAYLPDLRPLTGIGVVEGVFDLSSRGSIALGSPQRSAFESELNSFSTTSGNGHMAARTAFYFKGTILGSYLLSTAYDSDKPKNTSMFRDIQPDQFYPVYGDSSIKSFDAQSTGKLYVRIDKNRSFLLYGDFVTTSSPEVRQLSQINRSVSGLRHRYEDKDLRIDSYLSRDTLTQQIQEFPANGTSGPFVLQGLGDMVINSETVEVLVRDRNQLQTVLKTTQLTRFVDYTIEPLSKTLLFTAPVRSLDPDLNPQSIRVSYSVDSGGTPFWVAGTDAQFKVNDQLQLGAVAATDRNPTATRSLAAATALARLDEATTLSSEVVKTQSDAKGNGQAGRIELRRQDDQLKLVAQVNSASTQFDNPNATTPAGQTSASLRMELRLDPSTQLKAEGVYNHNGIGSQGSDTHGASVAVQRRLSDTVTAEVGVRTGQQSGPNAGSFNYGTVSSPTGPSMSQTGVSSVNQNFTSVRGRLTSKVPEVPQAEVFVEAEQGITDGERHALTVGGNYQITDQARLYGRYALVSNLYNNQYDANTTQQNNVGLIGVETAYMEGGRLFNEYRMVDTIDGRGAQAVLGVRNMLKLTDHLRGTAGLEHTGALGGVPGLGSTAVTGGLEYTLENQLRASTTVELRHGTDANSALNTLGLALKLDADWSLLARSVVSSNNSRAVGGATQLLQRQQIGFAYRPVDQDLWNAIGRYEHRLQNIGVANAGSSLTLPGSTRTESQIISLQANVQPERSTILSARYALKWARSGSDGISTSGITQLLLGRITRDLNASWDLGLQAGLTLANGTSTNQTILGLEAGYQLMPNLWMSGGYNFMGIKDPDLGGSAFTAKGPYVRMRFKFDENTISPRDKKF
ncbi:hypothetical protein PSQ39_14295 [Curvibacter sp. HBC28]|uniref:DUF11 domain-containing protein n=1 Tax=Curvibacter microcysteis TaxID=3026419 RepID=A0ABT5MIT8_9BURK|nr:hypothetical protein [Curvibacter sp. HBC28]